MAIMTREMEWTIVQFNIRSCVWLLKYSWVCSRVFINSIWSNKIFNWCCIPSDDSNNWLARLVMGPGLSSLLRENFFNGSTRTANPTVRSSRSFFPLVGSVGCNTKPLLKHKWYFPWPCIEKSSSHTPGFEFHTMVCVTKLNIRTTNAFDDFHSSNNSKSPLSFQWSDYYCSMICVYGTQNTQDIQTYTNIFFFLINRKDIIILYKLEKKVREY